MSRSMYGIGEWFKGLTTPEEIKKHYRKLAFEFHPDKGGDTQTMQEINNAYHEALKMLDRQVFNEFTYKYDFSREDAVCQKIKLVINLEGVTVEICGVWLWVTGDTYPHRKHLKESGFKFAGRKKAWYFHDMPFYRKRGKKAWSMDSIRNAYGSQLIEADEEDTKKRINQSN